MVADSLAFLRLPPVAFEEPGSPSTLLETVNAHTHNLKGANMNILKHMV